MASLFRYSVLAASIYLAHTAIVQHSGPKHLDTSVEDNVTEEFVPAAKAPEPEARNGSPQQQKTTALSPVVSTESSTTKKRLLTPLDQLRDAVQKDDICKVSMFKDRHLILSLLKENSKMKAEVELLELLNTDSDSVEGLDRFTASSDEGEFFLSLKKAGLMQSEMPNQERVKNGAKQLRDLADRVPRNGAYQLALLAAMSRGGARYADMLEVGKRLADSTYFDSNFSGLARRLFDQSLENSSYYLLVSGQLASLPLPKFDDWVTSLDYLEYENQNPLHQKVEQLMTENALRLSTKAHPFDVLPVEYAAGRKSGNGKIPKFTDLPFHKNLSETMLAPVVEASSEKCNDQEYKKWFATMKKRI